MALTFVATVIIAIVVGVATSKSSKRLEELLLSSRRQGIHESLRDRRATYDELKDTRSQARKWFKEDETELGIIDELFYCNPNVPLPNAFEQQSLSLLRLQAVAATIPERFDKEDPLVASYKLVRFAKSERRPKGSISGSPAYIVASYVVDRSGLDDPENPTTISPITELLPQVPIEGTIGALNRLGQFCITHSNTNFDAAIEPLNAVLSDLLSRPDISKDELADVIIDCEIKLLSIQWDRQWKHQSIAYHKTLIPRLVLELLLMLLLIGTSPSRDRDEYLIQYLNNIDNLLRSNIDKFVSQRQYLDGQIAFSDKVRAGASKKGPADTVALRVMELLKTLG